MPVSQEVKSNVGRYKTYVCSVIALSNSQHSSNYIVYFKLILTLWNKTSKKNVLKIENITIVAFKFKDNNFVIPIIGSQLLFNNKNVTKLDKNALKGALKSFSM